MDTLTHALSGALLARATAPREQVPGELSVRRRVAAGFFAAAFPDIDIVGALLSPIAYLYFHRGITHSLILLPLWAWLLAWLAARTARGGPPPQTYVGVIAASIAIHILGDLITSFGTMIWAPLSDARVAWSTTFIIDLWFTGIILAGLAASVVWRRARIPAIAACAVLAGYVGLQWLAQGQALAFAERHAMSRGLADYRVSALPRPASPFHWMVIVETPEGYEFSHVSLTRRESVPEPGPEAGFFTRIAAPYFPLARAQWDRATRFGDAPADRALAEAVWREAGFAFFRWFAAYPALHGVERGNPSECAWFHDLRFYTPGRATWPFRYGMCRSPGGAWEPFELDGSRRARLID